MMESENTKNFHDVSRIYAWRSPLHHKDKEKLKFFKAESFLGKW